MGGLQIISSKKTELALVGMAQLVGAPILRIKDYGFDSQLGFIARSWV